jgi:hypothetical protein
VQKKSIYFGKVRDTDLSTGVYNFEQCPSGVRRGDRDFSVLAIVLISQHKVGGSKMEHIAPEPQSKPFIEIYQQGYGQVIHSNCGIPVRTLFEVGEWMWRFTLFFTSSQK